MIDLGLGTMKRPVLSPMDLWQTVDEKTIWHPNVGTLVWDDKRGLWIKRDD